MYCNDNSYAYNQSTGINECIAGNWYKQASKVRVLLSPFKMSTANFANGEKRMLEFIVVETEDGSRHVVLNDLLTCEQYIHKLFYKAYGNSLL